MQPTLFDRLAAESGKDRAWADYPAGTGGFADAIARFPNGCCHLYEIKIDIAVKVVRLAIGQLMEYDFRGGRARASEIVCRRRPFLPWQPQGRHAQDCVLSRD